MAKEMKVGLLIEAATNGLSDLKKMIGSLKNAGENTDELDKEFNQLYKTLEKLKTADQNSVLDKLSGDANNLERDLKAANEEAKRLKKLQDAKITLGIENDDKVKRQIEEVGKAYNHLKASGTLSSKELARANELHKIKVKELEASLQSAKPKMEDIALGMGKIVTAGAGLALVAKEAMEFETAMADVKKVVDGTDEQMSQLGDQVKDLAYELGIVPEQVAAIAAQGGQLGVAFEDLPEFTRLAGQMSVAFGMTAEEAGNAAAKLTNVFGITLDEVRSLGDAINTLGNNTAAKESEITAAMLRIGGSAKQFGLAAEQAAALADAFIALGKPPEVAATAINALLNKLQTAPAASDSFKNALGELGISAEQLAQNIKENPEQALVGFMEKLEKLDKQQRATVATKLFGQEYADDISLAVGSLDTLRNALGLVANKSENAGAMQREFEAAMSNTAAQISRAKIAISNMAETIGKELLPIIGTIADGVGGIAKSLNDFAKEHPAITHVVTLLASAKVASYAVSTALKVMGVEGRSALELIKAGTVSATTNLKAMSVQARTTAASMADMGGTTRTLKADVVGLGKQLTTLQGILNSLISFDVGWSFGTWLRDSSDTVRDIGDEMGRVASYIEAIFTDRTFDDVNNNFKTTVELEAELKEASKQAEEAAKARADAEAKAAAEAAAAAEERSKAEAKAANERLLRHIELKSQLDEQKKALADMAENGQQGTKAYDELNKKVFALTREYNGLNAEINASTTVLSAHDAVLNKSVLALDGLGTSFDELKTGISDTERTALNNFSNALVGVGNDTEMLGRLFDKTMSQMNSPEARQALVDNFKEGAGAIGVTKDAMQGIIDKSGATTDALSSVFKKLNLDVNQSLTGVSSKTQETLDLIKQGATEVGNSTKSAAEKTKLLSDLFATGLNVAKTKEEFAAFNDVAEKSGLIHQATAEQIKIVQAGMRGGAETAKAEAEALAENSVSKRENAEAAAQNAEAEDKATDAKNKNTEATEKNADAQSKSAKAAEKSSTSYSQLYDSAGLAADQIQQLSDATDAYVYASNQHAFDGMNYDSIRVMRQEIINLNEAMHASNAEADAMTATLNSSSLTMDQFSDITQRSQHVMQNLGNERLDALRNAIDDARQRMSDLKQQAEDTADSLEAELAKMRGDNSVAAHLEQERKLRELNAKLHDAELRRNEDEIAQYQRAIQLQQQIGAEKAKQAKQQAEEAKQRELERKQQRESTRSSSSNQTQSRTTSSGGYSMPDGSHVAQELASTIGGELTAREKQIAENAQRMLADELRRQFKGRAY